MATLHDVLRPEISGVAGVPETELAAELLPRLPRAAPPAPWHARFSGVVWVGRGGLAARHALPPALRHHRALVVGGAALRYQETPVGPYDEVLGVVGFLDGFRPVGSVAFMAVDSGSSLVGGRVNWGMPKSLAGFSGDPTGGQVVATSTGGLAWRVEVTAQPFGPRLRVAGRLTARQQCSTGTADSLLRGRSWARPALVHVAVESDGPLPTWLRPGRHLGAVLESAWFDLGEPGGGR